jgi:hypothetical protein
VNPIKFSISFSIFDALESWFWVVGSDLLVGGRGGNRVGGGLRWVDEVEWEI